jgi:hypothetical protein
MPIILDGTSGVTTPGITDSGNLSVAGTASITGATTLTTQLGVAGGGTGATTLTANNVILGNGTSAVSFVAPDTNGNILTSNGTTWSSTAPASQGMTLLGTITPTAVNSISLSGLTLTSYKSLFIVFNNITFGGPGGCYISSSNIQTGGGLTAASAASGTAWLDLGTGAVGGNIATNTVTSTTNGIGGLTNVATSTTQIYFRCDAAKTWTAAGSIVIYGVK